MNYKVVLCGDPQSGKTAYLRRLCSNTFVEGLPRSSLIDVRCVSCWTTRGVINFTIWNVAGDASDDVFKVCCRDADAILIFFSGGRLSSALRWLKLVTAARGELPVVFCAGRVDRGRTSLPVVVPISAKRGRKLTEPLLRLARKLTGDVRLSFTPPQ